MRVIPGFARATEPYQFGDVVCVCVQSARRHSIDRFGGGDFAAFVLLAAASGTALKNSTAQQQQTHMAHTC